MYLCLFSMSFFHDCFKGFTISILLQIVLRKMKYYLVKPILACFYPVFSPFEFHEYLKLLRFQQVSCPESEVGALPQTLHNFLTFYKLYSSLHQPILNC